MSTIIDQGSDREITPPVESEVDAYYAVYRKRMGHDPRPEEDITMEQLSGLKALFASGAAPYVRGPRHVGALRTSVRAKNTV